MTGLRRIGTFLSCVVAATASCTPSSQEGGGIGGTGIIASVASGPITDFGSVFVSGVEYDTTGAAFTVDGRSGASQHDLKKGMVVQVEATLLEETATRQILKRTADRVSYTDTVEGPVQRVDLNGTSLTMMGQTVLITDDTIIDDSVPGGDLLQLRPNVDILEVSGFVSGDGLVIATLIDRKIGTPDYEVKGLAKDHDAIAQTFRVGLLTVDYEGADIANMPAPSGNAWEGLPVDVVGDQFSPAAGGQPGGRLRATLVRRASLGVQETRRAEIEGFVSQIVSPGSFLVGQIQVQFDDQTIFEGGTAADLGPGVRVEVNGTLAADVLQAARIELNGRVKLRSIVSTVETTDGLSGTIVLSGLPGTVIHVTPQTQLKGVGAPLRFADVTPGDQIVIRGEPAGEHVLATDLVREVPDDKAVLLGPVSRTAPPRLTILGTDIDTSPLPDSAFRRADDSPIGRAPFFSAVRPGLIVEVAGTRVGTVLQWEEVELQE